MIEEIEKEVKKFEITQRGLMDSSIMAFNLFLKQNNPTVISSIGSILNDTYDELMILAGDYLNEIAKLNREEATWEEIQQSIVAYSSVIAHLHSLEDRLQLVEYYMESKVPKCFKKKALI